MTIIPAHANIIPCTSYALVPQLQIKKDTLNDRSIYLFPKLGNHPLEFIQFMGILKFVSFRFKCLCME